MRDEIEKYRLFSRRAFVLCALKFSTFSLILSKYYSVQILNSDRYKVLSDKNRVKLTVLPPFRGLILDRNGEVLASNKKFYRVLLDSSKIGNAMDYIKKINKILGRKVLDESKENLNKRIKKKKHFSPLTLGKYLSWEEVSKIEFNADILRGIEIDIGQERFYPYGTHLSHIIGYIGNPSIEESKNSFLPNFQDFKVGKNGVEQHLNRKLRGIPGFRKDEVDAHGTKVRRISVQQPVIGRNASLAINATLQSHITGLMSDKQGAIVVIDVRTGDVLAMQSSPSYDPNLFNNGISYSDWDNLLKNKHQPLINKAISIPYPPGSIFKIITSLAALEAGIPYHYKVQCKGRHRVGTHTFRCWKKSTHGTVKFQDAIAQSCNIFFYDIAQKIGIHNIKKMADKMGLGYKTGIQLPFENSGLIPSKQWKKRMYDMDWYIGDTVNTAIGQGYTLTTPIQLALMSARLASGRELEPNILLQDNIKYPKLNINTKHLEFVRKGMYMVLNSKHGTARFYTIPSFRIAGKTGTAQIVSMDSKKKGKAYDDHSMFTGFAPYNAPKYAISVVVEHGRWGAASAAPLAKQIFLKLKDLANEK